MTIATNRFADLPSRHPGGLRLHYREWGEDTQPIVLLHGLASNARIWDLTAPAIAPRFRALALDQRGHGLSDKPDCAFSFEEVSGDLLAFLDTLSLDRPVVVGHSWGGNVLLQFAAQHSDRLRGAVFLDGGFLDLSSQPGMDWEQTREKLAPPQLDGMNREEFLRTLKKSPQFTFSRRQGIEEIVLANFEVDGGGRIHPHLRRENHMKILRAMWEQRPSALWSRVGCPALLLPAVEKGDGRQSADWLEGKRQAVAVAQAQLRTGRTVWLENSIHDVPLQRPDELAYLISDFASSVR